MFEMTKRQQKRIVFYIDEQQGRECYTASSKHFLLLHNSYNNKDTYIDLKTTSLVVKFVWM